MRAVMLPVFPHFFRHLANHLPAWTYYGVIVGTLVEVCCLLKEPRPDIALTAIASLSWVTIYFSVHIFQGTFNRQKAVALVGLALGVLVVPAVIVFWLPHRPLEYGVSRWFFEVNSFLIFPLLLIYAWSRGRNEVIVFFGIAAVYGVLLENGGIEMGYFHEIASTFYLPYLPAPLTTMLGWVIVLYQSIFIVESLVRRFPKLQDRFLSVGFLTAINAVSLDLLMDPVATEIGVWVWDSRLPILFLGVPTINWFAWVYAVFPFASVYFFLKYHRRSDGDVVGQWNQSKLLRFALSLPLILVADSVLFFGTFAILEGGFNGPTWIIFKNYLALTV